MDRLPTISVSCSWKAVNMEHGTKIGRERDCKPRAWAFSHTSGWILHVVYISTPLFLHVHRSNIHVCFTTSSSSPYLKKIFFLHVISFLISAGGGGGEWTTYFTCDATVTSLPHKVVALICKSQSRIVRLILWVTEGGLGASTSLILYVLLALFPGLVHVRHLQYEIHEFRTASDEHVQGLGTRLMYYYDEL